MKRLSRALPTRRRFRRRKCVPALRMTLRLRWMTEGHRYPRSRP